MSESVMLLDRTILAGDVQVLKFNKPQNYSYEPGQWSLLQLPDLGENDERGLQRPLSIVSAPEEDFIGFATKITDSAFKQSLAKIEVGGEVQISSARGKFRLPKNKALPICFLAGGIGITPFRSLAMHSSISETGHQITLLYSSRTPEETPFLEDFEALDAQGEKFKFVSTITRMHLSERSWSGREGRMDVQMIQDEFPEWNRGVFYVAGPPRMVDTMLEMLETLNIPKERLHVENFAGY